MMQARTRGGFALHPIVIFLSLILVGIVAWKFIYQRDLVPSGHPRAAAIKRKITTTALSTVIGSAAITAGVGAGCFFAFRRSQRASNFGMATCMAIPVSLLSYQAYLTMTTTRPPAPTAASPGTPSSTQPGSAKSPMQSLLDSQKAQLQKQNERTFEVQRNLRSHSPLPAPRPLATSPQPAQPAPQAPAVHTPPAIQVPSAQTPAPKAPDPNTSRALEKLENEIDTQASDAIARLEPILARIAKPPKQDKADLRKRSEDAATARQLTESLSTRLRGVIDEARATLDAIAADNSHDQAIRFSNNIDANQRAFAADSIGRILDQAREEADFLLANFGQWRTARDGKIESKDFSIQSRAHSFRFFIETWLKNKDREFAKLRGD